MSSSNNSQNGGRSRVALVCDDEAQIRLLFALLLEDAGFQVEVANDGQEALQKINGRDGSSFDVVITDSCMPKLDGFGLVGALRAAGFTGKIIVVSGFLDAEAIGRYKHLGVDRIIWKNDGVTNIAVLTLETLEQ